LIQKRPDGMAPPGRFSFQRGLVSAHPPSDQGNGAPHPFGPDFPMLGLNGGRSTCV